MKAKSSLIRPGLWLVLTLLMSIFVAPVARAADSPQKGDSVQIMEAFDRNATRIDDANVLNDHKKHVVMFIMGVPLLILVLITGGLGIAMAVFGKQRRSAKFNSSVLVAGGPVWVLRLDQCGL